MVVDFFRLGQRGEIRPLREADLGIEPDLIDRENDILGSEGNTVMPLRILAQVESPGKAAIGYAPAFREIADDFLSRVVICRQVIEQDAIDHDVLDTADQRPE